MNENKMTLISLPLSGFIQHVVKNLNYIVMNYSIDRLERATCHPCLIRIIDLKIIGDKL